MIGLKSNPRMGPACVVFRRIRDSETLIDILNFRVAIITKADVLTLLVLVFLQDPIE